MLNRIWTHTPRRDCWAEKEHPKNLTADDAWKEPRSHPAGEASKRQSRFISEKLIRKAWPHSASGCSHLKLWVMSLNLWGCVPKCGGSSKFGNSKQFLNSLQPKINSKSTAEK